MIIQPSGFMFRNMAHRKSGRACHGGVGDASLNFPVAADVNLDRKILINT
jgi:hypothetical protein